MIVNQTSEAKKHKPAVGVVAVQEKGLLVVIAHFQWFQKPAENIGFGTADFAPAGTACMVFLPARHIFRRAYNRDDR